MIRNVVITAAAMMFVAAGSAFGQDATKPPVMSHDLEGKDNCAMCHSGAMEGIAAAPADHEGRGPETCVQCHAPDSEMQTSTANAIPHDLEGKDNCSMCHSGAMEGMPAAPASHEGRGADTCQMCHEAAG
jgi:hypothetical protein